MSASFHIYGDESTSGDNVIYAFCIVPIDMVATAEESLAKTKEKFNASRAARFHCKELFHADARRRTEWAHLSNKQACDLALAVTYNLANLGVETIVGHVNRNDFLSEMPGVGNFPSMQIKDTVQLVPYAFSTAVAQFSVIEKYKNNCKLWVDPNPTKINWYGSGRKVERALKLNQVDLNSRTISPILLPENLISKEKPRLLEIADLLAYSTSRVINNPGSTSSHYSDAVIKEINKIMGPVVLKFKPAPVEEMKEGVFKNFRFK
jgi:hypothetical protein